MAKLDIKEIEHIARLSRLELTAEEKELYSEQLSSVLDYVEQLSGVDTENIQPLSNVTGLENVARKDEKADGGISHEKIAKNAPRFEDGSFVVPGVFE